MNYNQVIASIACVLGISGILFQYITDPHFFLNSTIASILLVTSLLGLIGIYLFDRNYKLSNIQYALCGVILIIPLNLLGIISGITYLAAAIVANSERNNSGTKSYSSFEDIRVYCNDYILNTNYGEFFNILDDKKLQVIPIISLIIILLAVFSSIAFIVMNEENIGSSLTIDNMNSSMNYKNGYYSGVFEGYISSDNFIELYEIRGVWYDEDDSIIDTTYDNGTNINIYENKHYKTVIPYNSKIKPSKIRIDVYGFLHEDPIYNKTVNFN